MYTKQNAMKIFLSGLFLFSSISLFAQLNHPHFLSMNFGTNVPLGEFKKADSIYGGSANNGLYYSFEAGAYFSRLFGIALNIGAFSNSVNEESVEEQLKNDFNFIFWEWLGSVKNLEFLLVV